TFAGRARSAIRSWSSTSSASDGIGKRSFSSTKRCPDLWQRTNACGALRDRVLQERAPRRREPPALRGDAHERDGRPERERLRDAADDRNALVRLPRPFRVEDRGHLLAPVAEQAAGRLAVVRVGRVPLGEEQEPTRA